MSRAIKFRVWDNTKRQMFPVRELFWRHNQEEMAGNYWFVESEEDTYGQEVWIPRTEVNGSKHIGTFMQFTGLVDRNGVDIYEGDIVKAFPKYGWPEDDQRVAMYAVVFSEFEGCWALKDERKIEDCPSLYSSGIYSRRNEQLEVIGNIYETPEQGAEQ